MKRLLSIVVLLSLLAGSAAQASGYLDYGSYQNDFMEAVSHEKWQVAVNLYEEICELWPNAVDRKGDVDRYGLYADGRLAMDGHDYNKAIADFDSLGDGFPSAEDPLNSKSLKTYCQAQRFLEKGLNTQALAYFRMCANILDSAVMIRFLTEDRQETLFGFDATVMSASQVYLSWVDMDDSTQTYSFTYMPKDVETAAKTVLTESADLVLNDLIPRTTYVAYLTPLKNGTVSGLSVQAEFSTSAAQRPRSLQILEPMLYAYSMEARNQYNNRMRTSEDRFLSAFSYSNQVQQFIQMGSAQAVRTIKVPFGSLDGSFNASGYIFQCVLSRNESSAQKDGTIRVVVRAAYAENPNLVYWMDVPFGFQNRDKNYSALTFYLDPLLDQVYNNQGWPDDTDLIFELYLGEELLFQDAYHLIIG